jgi:hypothetical protein
VVLLQLYDNSVYLVGGAAGTKSLPKRDSKGVYHVVGALVVADNAGIKDVTNKLVPLVRALESVKKLFLSPLARYQLDPCCATEGHVTNYQTPGYLARLGAATASRHDFIRDALFKRHTSNFRVLCPNKMLGIGPQ